MALKVGIAGLPNAGKSTLFNALLGRSVADTAPYPFCTIEPNVGVVGVPDNRLDELARVLEPDEKIPAAIEFFDIAGLVEGAHEGEGLGNAFLSHIREVDVILHLVRDFESGEVERVGSVDPQEDLQTINTELLLKDLETLSKLQIQSVGRRTKFQIKEKKEKIRWVVVEKVRNALEEGRMAREAGLTEEEEEEIKDLNLLTLKPQLVVVNMGEDVVSRASMLSAGGEGKESSRHYSGLASAKRSRSDLESNCNGRQILNQVQDDDRSLALGNSAPVTICAKLEEDLSEFSKRECLEYLNELGIESGVDRIIEECYKLLDLITFYTVKGGEILRAWPLKQGLTVIEAAEIVHSDFAENFIRAEVIQAEELIEMGSWVAAKEEGLVAVRGRDYEVKDGDVIEFKI